VGSEEEVNRVRVDLEAAYPRFVIIHTDQLATASRLRMADVLGLSATVAACPAARTDARNTGLRSRVSVKHGTVVTSNAATTQ
jgi:hypothetical protein